MNAGEVWVINLDPSIGAEIKKSRPCVVVNRDSIGLLPLKIVVPLTAWQAKFERAPWLVAIDPSKTNGISKRSAADTFQVRSLSQERFVHRLGVLAAEDLRRIKAGLVISLGLDQEKG